MPIIDISTHKIPELPVAFATRISSKYELEFNDVYDIYLMKVFNDTYLDIIEINPKLATSWIKHTVTGAFAEKYKEPYYFPDIKDSSLVDLFCYYEVGKISDSVMKKVLNEIVFNGLNKVETYLYTNNLLIDNTLDLNSICIKVIEKEEKTVCDYKEGNEKALNKLIGLVIKETKGKANPKDVSILLKTLII